MAKRMKAGPLDESLIIRSFKDAGLVADPADAVLPGQEQSAERHPAVLSAPVREEDERDPAPESGDTAASRRPRRRKGSYEEVYLARKEIKARQPVYISQEVHRSVLKLVRLLALSGREISVGGYIDNVLAEHLRAHRDEIAELCREGVEDML